MRKLVNVVLSASAVVAGCALITAARAETFVWTGAAKNGDWNDKVNWEVNKKMATRAPDTAGDVAQFPDAAVGNTITVNKAVTIDRVDFADPAAKGFSVNGKALNFESTSKNAMKASVVDVARGAVTIGSDVSFNKNDLIFDTKTDALKNAHVTVTGVVSSNDAAFRLIKAGGGTLVLAAENTYKGNTVVRAGELIVAKDKALGAVSAKAADPGFTRVESGAALTFIDKVDYKAAEHLRLAVGSIIRGTGVSSFGGPITLQGLGTPGDRVFFSTPAVGDKFTINGKIGEASPRSTTALFKTGDGLLILNAKNTFTTSVFIDKGGLQVNVDRALGTAEGKTNIGAPGGSNGNRLIFNDVKYATAEPVEVFGTGDRGVAIANIAGKSTFAGPILLQVDSYKDPVTDVVTLPNTSIDVAKTTDVDKPIELKLTGTIRDSPKNPQKLTKVGGGDLVLTGANTYAGGTEVAKGTLVAASNGALGAPAGAAVTKVDAKATLALRGGITLDNQTIRIDGKGVNDVGAIYNAAGNNTIGKNAPVVLDGDATVGAADKTRLTFLGTVDKNNHTLTPKPGAGAVITFDDKKADAAIKGGGDLIVDGPGKVVIASGSTYTGPTEVRAGTLEVSNTTGSATGLATVFVRPGATLQGTGIITGLTLADVNAVVRPGTDVPGILKTLGGVGLAPGSHFEILLGGVTAGAGVGFHSQLQVINGATLNGSALDVLLTERPIDGNQYDVLRNLDGRPVVGRFAGLSEGALFDVASAFGTFEFRITYFGGDGVYHDGSHNDVVLTALGAVPEPGPLTLFVVGAGLVSAVHFGRRGGGRSVAPAGLQVDLVERPLEHGRQDDARGRDQGEAAVQGVRAGEQLAAGGLERGQRAHAGEDHRGVGEGVDPAHAFEVSIAENASHQ